MGEFELIAKYFSREPKRAALGVGDDCAVFAPQPGHQLCVSCDMLVEGRHFLSTVPPQRLGHKSLAVNLSDLAACGAAPLSFMLALSMPRADEAFLEGFASGLWALADEFDIELIGGDTTAGPLNICITVFGEVPAGQALLRSGAAADDELWVSGCLGDARAALECFRGTLALDSEDFEQARRAMEAPQPRVALGQRLRGIASSAIDLSDGLLGDLAHLMQRSGVGASVQLDALPRSALLARLPQPMQRTCLLSGGDDYELLFSAPRARHDAVIAAGAAAGTVLTCIGRIEAGSALRVLDGDGRTLDAGARGFDHFRS